MATYVFTGKIDIVTVGSTGAPAPGTFKIVAYGAAGGGAGNTQSYGGYGAMVAGQVTLTAGEHLEIVVGGAGGYVGASTSNGGANGGGGGGGSFVLGMGTGNGSGNGSYTPLLIAGGGGGGYHLDGGNGNPSKAGTGTGGAGGPTGGGGAGLDGGGGAGTANPSSFQGGGGSNHVGGYAGGTGASAYGGGHGGFGGGGGGGSSGGGGGGGYTGGAGGGTSPDGSPGQGGSSFDNLAAPVSGSASGENNANGGNGEVVITQVVCFAAGTRIRVVRGDAVEDVAVEALCVGDLAVTASGAARPIRWLGHRRLDCLTLPRPQEALPVRIAAHAFAPNRPSRDLLLSPGHAICLDALGELLIPAGTLVNGATITRHPVDEITYWHVELDSHDILLAENLPVESFLDCGNRAGLVEQKGEYDRTIGPHTPVDFCRPFVDRGVVVDAFRTRLAACAEEQGWRSTTEMDLHLVVDGARIEPDVVDGVARFLFPAAARDVVLASESIVPSDLADSLDHRRLGVSVSRIEIDDGLSVRRAWSAGDPALATLFHPEEAAGGARHRFTNGRAMLPPSLWDGCRSFVILRIGFDGTRHWLPPGRAEACDVATLRVA